MFETASFRDGYGETHVSQESSITTSAMLRHQRLGGVWIKRCRDDGKDVKNKCTFIKDLKNTVNGSSEMFNVRMGLFSQKLVLFMIRFLARPF